MDKFYGCLAVDTALDQLMLYLMPVDLAGELRVLAWAVAIGSQWMYLRRWVATWDGLEAEAETVANGDLCGV